MLVRNNCAAITAISYTNSSCVVTLITGGKVMISRQVKVAKREANKSMYISMCTKDL